MRAGLLFAAALLAVGCGGIQSTIGIDARTQFVLGGEQTGSFVAELVNVGAAPVEVLEVTAAGDTIAVARLLPGDTASARFGAGSQALLGNRSSREAAVRADLRGDTQLGMGYAPVGDG